MSTICHTIQFAIERPIDEVFSLFSAEGEKLWVLGWDYDNVMGTTDLCEDYVFVTQTHDHGSTHAVWIVKSHDPANHYVQFYKVEPGDKVGVITVDCSQIAATMTMVAVTYKYTAISTKGDAFVESFTKDVYDGFIAEWQELLVAYFSEKD